MKMFTILICMAIGHVFGDLKGAEFGKDELKAKEDAKESLSLYVKEAMNLDQYLQSKDDVQAHTKSGSSNKTKTDEKPASPVLGSPLTSGAYEIKKKGKKLHLETREEQSLLKHSDRNTISAKKDSMMFNSFPVKPAAIRRTSKDLSMKQKSFRRKRDVFRHNAFNRMLAPAFGVSHPKARPNKDSAIPRAQKAQQNTDYTTKEKRVDVEIFHRQETDPLMISRSSSPRTSAASYSAMQYLLNKLPDVLKSKVLVTDDAEKVILENYVKSQSVPTEVVDAYNSAKKEERELLKRLLREMPIILPTYKALRKGAAWNYTRLHDKFMRSLQLPSPSLEQYEASKRNEFASLNRSDNFLAYSGRIGVPEGSKNIMAVEADTQKLRETEKVKVGAGKITEAMEAERRMEQENEMADEAEIRMKREVDTDEDEDNTNDDKDEETEDGDDDEDEEEEEHEELEGEEDEKREKANRRKKRKKKKKESAGKAKKRKPEKAEAEAEKQVNAKHTNKSEDEKKAKEAEKPEDKSKLNETSIQKANETAKGLTTVKEGIEGKAKPKDGNETKTQEKAEAEKAEKEKNLVTPSKAEEAEKAKNLVTPSKAEEAEIKAQETGNNTEASKAEKKIDAEAKSEEIEMGSRAKEKGPADQKQGKEKKTKRKKKRKHSRKRKKKKKKKTAAEKAENKETVLKSETQAEEIEKKIKADAENKGDETAEKEDPAEIEKEIKAEAENKDYETEDKEESAEEIEKEIKAEAEHKEIEVESEDDAEETDDTENERVKADVVQAYKLAHENEAQAKHTGGRKIKIKKHTAGKAKKQVFENVGRSRRRMRKEMS